MSDSPPKPVVVLHGDGVLAGAEVGSGIEVGGGHILPLVDDEPTVHI